MIGLLCAVAIALAGCLFGFPVAQVGREERPHSVVSIYDTPVTDDGLRLTSVIPMGGQ